MRAIEIGLKYFACTHTVQSRSKPHVTIRILSTRMKKTQFIIQLDFGFCGNGDKKGRNSLPVRPIGTLGFIAACILAQLATKTTAAIPIIIIIIIM